MDPIAFETSVVQLASALFHLHYDKRGWPRRHLRETTKFAMVLVVQFVLDPIKDRSLDRSTFGWKHE